MVGSPNRTYSQPRPVTPLVTSATCAETKTSFQFSDFSIGHRGAPLQFPEHTEISYKAAAQMGAGILECDVAFTKDLELVCRHAQCDLHTTTDVVTRPDLNAKCTTPWSPGVRPLCCTSDFTLEEIRTMCAKMDSSNNVNATTPEGTCISSGSRMSLRLLMVDSSTQFQQCVAN